VRTGFTILALVSHEDLSRIVREIGKELQKIEPEALRKQLPAILAERPGNATRRHEPPSRGE